MSWTILLWIVGAWMLLRVLPIFMAFLVLLRVTLQETDYAKLEESEVDPELAQFLRTVASPLRALGFEELAFLRIRRALRSAEDRVDTLELFHPATVTFASISPSETPDRWSASASFLTDAEPGPVFLTMNGLTHAMVGEYPGVEIHDPYAGSLEEAARSHFALLNGTIGLQGELGERLLRSEARDHRYLESLVATKEARPGRDPGTFELTAKGAFGGAKKILAARRALQQMALARRAHAEDHPELYPEPPLSEELKAYRRHESVRRAPNRRQTMAMIFAVTGLLFTLSMLHLFDAAALVVLVAVIFFHELGHYFAMRIFDYRDTTIFFIPFLGAAATGRKDRPSLGEEMIILLAGPMPGLAVGAALGFVPAVRDSELGRTAILMLVSVNLFNLLPIFPLDGGRIVHALLFAGRPWLDAGFKLIAVVAFVALGVWASEPVVVVIALFVALAIPMGFRTSRFEAEFRAEERVERPADLVRWIFARLRASDRPLPFVQKMALARTLEPRLLHESTRWWRTIPWLGAYGACVVGGVVAIAAGSLGHLFRAPATDRDRVALTCPMNQAELAGMLGAELICVAPNEEVALALQESLVLAETGAPFCVPGPWRDTDREQEEVRAARRRSLLTLRIGQHRSRTAGQDPGEALRMLIEEREDDPTFDIEVIELMIRGREDADGGRDARALMTRKLGGRQPCGSQLVFGASRAGREVSFSVTGSAALAAEHLCRLGCEVAYR